MSVKLAEKVKHFIGNHLLDRPLVHGSQRDAHLRIDGALIGRSCGLWLLIDLVGQAEPIPSPAFGAKLNRNVGAISTTGPAQFDRFVAR